MSAAGTPPSKLPPPSEGAGGVPAGLEGGPRKRIHRTEDEGARRGIGEYAADKGHAASTAVKRGGQAVELGGKGVKNVGRGVEAAGRGAEATGKGMQAAGKSVGTASKGVGHAGKAMDAAGTAATGTVVGGVVGVPVAAVGKATQAVGLGGQAAGKGLDSAGKGVSKGGAAAKKAGAKTKQAGSKVEQVGKATRDAGQRGRDAAKGAKNMAVKGKRADRAYRKLDPARAGARKLDSVTGTPVASAALKTGEGASKVGGAAAGAIAGGLVSGGLAAIPAAIVGAKGGKWAFRGAATGMLAFGLAFALILMSMSGSSLLALPQAEEDPEVVTPERVPPEWLDGYKELAYSYGVPWPIVAAIGEVTSQQGTIHPYTLEEMSGRFPRPTMAWIGPEEGGFGGYGPLLLSEWTVDNYLDGSRVEAQDAATSAVAIVEVLHEYADEYFDGGLCATLRAEADGDDSSLPSRCQSGGDGEQAADGELIYEFAAAETDTIESDLSEFVDMDDPMMRYGAFSRDFFTEGSWPEHVQLWYDVLTAVPLIEPTGNEMCLLNRDQLSVPQAIELGVRCAGFSVVADVEVGTVDAADNLTTATGRNGLATLAREAVAISWLYNEHGADVECNTEGTAGGYFPVPSEFEWYDSNGDGENDSRRVTMDRCDIREVTEWLANKLLEVETTPMGSRPGNIYRKAAAGWLHALPAAVGSDNTFLESGKDIGGQWSAGANANQCAVVISELLPEVGSNLDRFDEAWNGIYSSGADPEQFETAFDTLRGWGPWDTVESTCGPLYVEDENGRMKADTAWASAFTAAVDLYDPTGAATADFPVEARRFIGFHTRVESRDLTDPEWGVTAAFARLSDVDLHDVTPPWQPIGNMDVAAQIISVALEYIGESCADLGGNFGGIVPISGGDPGSSSGERFERAKRAAQAAWDVGFRGEELLMIVAIAGPESQWIPDNENGGSRNAGSTAVGTWQVMWSVWQGIAGGYGYTYEDMKRLEPNAFMTRFIYEDAISRRGWENRWEPWQVTHAGYDMVTTEYQQIAADAIAEQLGARANDPAPDGMPDPSGGSALQTGLSGIDCGFGSGMAANIVGADGWVCPVAGPTNFIDDWGFARGGGSRSHEGLDMFGERGTPLVAIEDGVITSTRYSQTGGESIRVTTDDPEATYWFYTHLDALHPAMHDGKRVQQGEVIGYMGNTGNARTTPVHLHIERHPGGWKNPQPLFDLMATLCAENRTNG